MQLFYQLEDYQIEKKSIVLTIGNFDGVHRGHQAVLRRTQEIAHDQCQTMVMTFSNHPSKVLRPQHPINLLCTLEHRIRLIEACGIDSLLLLPFTNYLAQHSAASFVERLRQHLPFTHLVLGHDATLGRDRQGNPAVMQELGQDWGFDLHYLEEYRYEGHPVSSSRIRTLLQNGDLDKVEGLLGRPFSIYAKAMPGFGLGIGKEIEDSVLHFEVDGLCLPPLGIYDVFVKKGAERFTATAHLEEMPERPEAIRLEVQLPGKAQNFYEQEIEVIFRDFISN